MPIGSLPICLAETFAERSIAVVVQPPFALLILGPDHAGGGIVGAIACLHGIGQDAAEKTLGAGCRAGPATGDGTGSFGCLDLAGRLSTRHVLDKLANVGRCQVFHCALAEKRNDVPLNTPSVGIKGRSALGVPAVSEDQTPLSLIEVLPAQGLHRHCAALHLPILGGISTLENVSQADLGRLAGFLHRQNAISPHRESPASAIGVAILNEEGLGPALLHPEAKPRQFVIPDKEVRPYRVGGIDNSFRDFDHLASGKQRVSRRR